VAIDAPVAILSGMQRQCALTQSGEVHCWGRPMIRYGHERVGGPFYRVSGVEGATLAAIPKGNQDQLIVVDRRGRLWPWSRMTAYRKVTGIMEKARISGPWAVPKGLRHGFGVRAIHSGVPLNLVQRWLGHADMKTTAIYANASGPEERQIAARAWLTDDSAYEFKRATA